jgi:hypothetical protein
VELKQSFKSFFQSGRLYRKIFDEKKILYRKNVFKNFTEQKESTKIVLRSIIISNKINFFIPQGKNCTELPTRGSVNSIELLKRVHRT